MKHATHWTRLPESAEQVWTFQFTALDNNRGPTAPIAQCSSTDLYPRFSVYYAQMRRLPRRVRRAMAKKAKVSLAGAAFLLALGQEPAMSATFMAGNATELIAAINQANDEINNPGPDTIALTDDIVLMEVDNSTYGPTGLPVITSTVTIEGNDKEIERNLASSEFRIFAVNATGDLTINETTVSGGATDLEADERHGGGILNQQGSLTIENSTVSGSSAFVGGGVSNLDGGVSILNSTVSSNSGGGIYQYYGTISVMDSTVSGNTDGGLNVLEGELTVIQSTVSGNIGGGMSISSAIATVRNSTVSGNSVEYGGAGISHTYGTLILSNSTIANNSAFGSSYGSVGYGGGFYSDYAYNRIEDTTFSNNYAGPGMGYGGAIVPGYGGAIYTVDNRYFSITNTTFRGNSAGRGAAIYTLGDVVIKNSTFSANSSDGDMGEILKAEYGTIELGNVIVANNLGGNCSGGIGSLGHNLVDDESCSPNSTTDKTPMTFPGLTVALGTFVDDGPGRGHFPVLPESDAIDMGDPATCPPNDQLGNPRVGVCDIGAVEFLGETITEGALDVEGNGVPDALTDGILVLRFLFGFSGNALIGGGVVDQGCTRCTAEDIEDFLGEVLLDVDGNGNADALTDGILILRFLFEFRGEALVAGGVVAPGCTRCTAEEIEAFLEPGTES